MIKKQQKDTQYNDQKGTKRQTLKIESHKKPGVKSGAPEGQQFVIKKTFLVDLLMNCLIDVQLIVSFGMTITSLQLIN